MYRQRMHEIIDTLSEEQVEHVFHLLCSIQALNESAKAASTSKGVSFPQAIPPTFDPPDADDILVTMGKNEVVFPVVAQLPKAPDASQSTVAQMLPLPISDVEPLDAEDILVSMEASVAVPTDVPKQVVQTSTQIAQAAVLLAFDPKEEWI